MKYPPRIAIVNVEWSEDYQGGDSDGYYGGFGNERFNFKTAMDGRYFVYVPPSGGKFPNPTDPTDWLVFMVSREPGATGLVVVGWFEQANFIGSPMPRPDSPETGLNEEGEPFTYSFEAESAVLIPSMAREFRYKGDIANRAFTYLRGGKGHNSRWGKLTNKLLAYRDDMRAALITRQANDMNRATGGFCVDPVKRAKIEKAAIRAVKAQYKAEYRLKDRQLDCCGYDLEFTHKQTREIMCVEVKGTEGFLPRFIISFNEHYTGQRMWVAEQTGEAGNLRRWRLAVVTDALGSADIETYNFSEMKTQFSMRELAWQAVPATQGKEKR